MAAARAAVTAGGQMRVALMHRALAGGGTESDLCRMAAELARRGHEVHAFVARPDGAPPSVRVRRVPIVRAGRLARLLSFALLAPRAVAREAFDVVIGFGRTPRQDVVRVGGGTHRSYLAQMEAAGLRRHGRGPYHRAILWLERRMFAPTGHRRVLAVSRRVADEVVRDYGVDRARVVVLYNGVDLERFHPGRRPGDGLRMRAALGLGPEPLCLAIGSGFARKGVDILLDLWEDGPPAGATLVVAGDDERLGAYRRRAAAAGGVRLLGARADVPELLAAADVVCVPSRQEAFGNVVLEALAAGVPVVTSRRAGAAELIDGALAPLVIDDPGDRPALRAAIERALAGDRAHLAAAARTLAERHPWARHMDRLEQELTEVARAR